MPSLISVCFIIPQMSPEAGETAIGMLQAGALCASFARHYEVNLCSDCKEGISKPARQMAIQDLVVLGWPHKSGWSHKGDPDTWPFCLPQASIIMSSFWRNGITSNDCRCRSLSRCTREGSFYILYILCLLQQASVFLLLLILHIYVIFMRNSHNYTIFIESSRILSY